MIDVAVIGGGVSGLAAAYELRCRGYGVTVLERQARPGGNAVSERFGGFLMEHGPSTMASESESARDLSRRLGLEAGRRDLGDGVRRRYLVGGGALQGIPVDPFGFLRADYLSLGARLRLVTEFAVPRGPAGREETVAEFCARRFGREFVDRVIDPLIGGIYAGRADRLSAAAAFPRLVALERECGSITFGMLRARWRGGRMPGSRLFSWADGIGALPRALAARLGEAVRTGVAVRRVRPVPGGYRIDAGPAGSFTARAVVVATQPHVAARLLEGVDAAAADAAGGIAAPPLAVAFLGYRRQDVGHPLDGLGFLVPRAEGRSITGAQFCSTMFPGRAPAGHVAIAGYFGGDRAPELALTPGPELIDLARAEYRDLLGAKGEPVVARVRHWPRGLPQYGLGHGERVAALASLGERRPGAYVTGNYLAGPSVAVCLGQALETAAEVDRHLAQVPETSPIFAMPPGQA